MYDKDLDGIEVEGEEGYREAKEFMRMLMPSQAKKITAYREPTPLSSRPGSRTPWPRSTARSSPSGPAAIW